MCYSYSIINEVIFLGAHVVRVRAMAFYLTAYGTVQHTSVTVIQGGPPGYFTHIPITTPVVPAFII